MGLEIDGVKAPTPQQNCPLKFRGSSIFQRAVLLRVGYLTPPISTSTYIFPITRFMICLALNPVIPVALSSSPALKDRTRNLRRGFQRFIRKAYTESYVQNISYIFQVIVATTDKLLVYSLPATDAPPASPVGPKTRSKKRQKQKSKEVNAASLKDMKLLKTVERPTLPGLNDEVSTTFRAVRCVACFYPCLLQRQSFILQCRFHPSSSDVFYTVLNTTSSGARKRGSKSPP